MNREELIAPENYNLVEEVEKFTGEQSKIAIKWVNETGKMKK